MKFKYLVCKLDNPNLDININSEHISERVKTFTLFGEVGHPTNPEHITYIDMTNVSHVITDVYIIDNCLYIDGKTLDTPGGQDLVRMYKSGADINFEIRALGNEEKLDIITFDWVTKPSNKYAKLICMQD